MLSGLALIFGFFAACAALVVQIFFSLLLSAPLMNSPSLALLIGAAGIEESAKLVFLIQLGRRSAQPVTLFTAFLFGIGFVAAELSLLAFSAVATPLTTLALVMIAAIHIFGAFLLYAGLRFRESFPLAPLIALLSAILMHTLYNSSL